jgi:RNA polymerase sigma-70 factor (ECF subfamily)
MSSGVDDARLRGLMAAYQDGAYAAFEELYAALAAPVRSWHLARTRDRARAEDLVQETFLQVHRARRTYDPAYPVVPWVMAIARHVYLMDCRTASRRPRYVAEDAGPERTVAPEAEARLRGLPVREALGRVTRDQRDALLLHHVGGWSFREIAGRLGIRETAAKLRSSRGMARLREELSPTARPSGAPSTGRDET